MSRCASRREGHVVLAAMVSLVTLASAGGALADTLTVNWDGSGDYLTIQAALNDAGTGDVVVVMPSTGAPGDVYAETLTFPSLAITLRSSDPDNPAVVAATVVDAGNADRVLTFGVNVPSGALVEGLTFRNGTADQGGGLRCANSTFTLRKCVVEDCTGVDGGGMFIWNSTVTIEDCIFRNNHATGGGGGLYCQGFGSAGVLVTLTGTEISNNTLVADWAYGGGIHVSGLDLDMKGCTVSQNSATDATGLTGMRGGGVSVDDCSATLTVCTIVGNTATGGQGDGAGVGTLWADLTLTACTIADNTLTAVEWCNGGGVSANASNVTATGCTITGNQVLGGYPSFYNGGAGLQVSDGIATLTDCTLCDNLCDAAPGGAVWSGDGTTTITRCRIGNNEAVTGGGVFHWGGALTILDSELVRNHSGGDGGGVYAAESSATVRHCTLAYNTADDFLGFGGGVQADDVQLTISHCAFWENVAVAGMGLSLSYWDPAVGSTADVSYTDLPGGAGDVYIGVSCTLNWLAGNLDVDPAFVDPDGPDNDPDTWDDNDYHLAFDSPLVGRGDPAFVPDPGETDIDGDARMAGCFVDLGADESTTMLDCNNNGKWDDCDLSGGGSEDCNHNGVPDECDLSAGTSSDCNGSAIPDECEALTAGDWSGDGAVSLDDLAGLIACLAGPDMSPAPLDPACTQTCLDVFDLEDGTGDVDLADVASFNLLLGQR